MRLKVESSIGLLVLARPGLDDGSRNPFVACWWEDASKAVSLSTSFHIDDDVIIVFAPIERQAGRDSGACRIGTFQAFPSPWIVLPGCARQPVTELCWVLLPDSRGLSKMGFH